MSLPNPRTRSPSAAGFRPNWVEWLIWSLLLLVTFVSLVLVARVRSQRYLVAPEFFAMRAAGVPHLNIDLMFAVGPEGGRRVNPDHLIKVTPGHGFLIVGSAVDTISGKASSGLVLQIDAFDQVASTYGERRPDLVKSFNNPNFLNSGFELELSDKLLPPGTHELSFKLLDEKAQKYYVVPNRIRIDVSG